MKLSHSFLVAGALALVSATAQAQTPETPTVSVAAGYSYVHDVGAKQDLPSGFFLSGAYYFLPKVAVVAEIGAGSTSTTFAVESTTTSVTTTIHVFMVGGQYRCTLQGLHLNGHVMGGAAHETGAEPIFRLSVAEAETKPIVQMGVGLDVPLHSRLSANVSIDYRRIFSDSYEANKEVRLAVGLGVGFGAR